MPTTLNEGYPHQYENWLTLKNGRNVFLRPILQTDGDLLTELFNNLSPQSINFRFLRPLRALPENLLYRFTHIHYDNEFALVAVIKENGKDAIISVARYGYDPQYHFTEVSVAVRDDWQNVGLGKSLLVKIIAIGKERGIARFVFIMNPKNDIMRQTLQKLGYKLKYSFHDGLTRIDVLV
jgi:acetyltransferase